MLGITSQTISSPPSASSSSTDSGAVSAPRYLSKLDEFMISLDNILTSLHVDPNPPPSDRFRPKRGTGAALSLAVALLEILAPQSPARAMLFVGGPCTTGPGQVVGLALEEKMRYHHNIAAGSGLTHLRAAKAFYDEVGKRAAANGHAIDVFIASQDQVGYYEMRNMVELTGGLVSSSTDFDSSQFRLTFQKLFDRGDSTPDDLDLAFSPVVRVQTTPDLRLLGCLGHSASYHVGTVKSDEVGFTIGRGGGGVNLWKFGGMDSTATLCFVFDFAYNYASSSSSSSERQGDKNADVDDSISLENPPVIQIVCEYTRANRRRMMRVVTIPFHWAAPQHHMQDVLASFDMEAAACLVARLAMEKAENEEIFAVLKWIDRLLIRLTARFAVPGGIAALPRTPGADVNLVFPPTLQLFPQFMYYLRRSRFLRLFNHTPDETAYYRTLLNRENVSNMMTMIQPALLSFRLSQQPQMVLLDTESISKEAILLLDSFFRVIIHHGETVALWREQGYQNAPEHAHFKTLLDAPLQTAEEILALRFPSPSVLVCDQNSSQARFLVSQLNPSVVTTSSGLAQAQSPSSSSAGADGKKPGDVSDFYSPFFSTQEDPGAKTTLPVISDDVPLKDFLAHLKKIVLTNSSLR